MNAEFLIYVGAAIPFFWGIAHLFPTKSIVRGFGPISADNRNIVAMGWMIEGVTLLFIGALVAIVTAIEPRSTIATSVYITSSVCLVVFAVISLLTGFKIDFLPFRLCPLIFTSSALLIILGWKVL